MINSEPIPLSYHYWPHSCFNVLFFRCKSTTIIFCLPISARLSKVKLL